MAEHTTNPGYEATDADVTPLFKFLAFLAVFIVFSILAVILLFKVLTYYQPLLDDEVSKRKPQSQRVSTHVGQTTKSSVRPVQL